MERKKQQRTIILLVLTLSLLLLLALPVVLKGSIKNYMNKSSSSYSEIDMAKENITYSKQLDKDISNIDLDFQQLDNDLTNIDEGINNTAE